jgi:hypothetical protein
MQVVNFKNIKPVWGRFSDVYIGRAFYVKESGWTDSSIWHNPFKINSKTNRNQSIEMYETYIRGRLMKEPKLVESLQELANAQRLVCWCKPERCHGDILVLLMREYGFL